MHIIQDLDKINYLYNDYTLLSLYTIIHTISKFFTMTVNKQYILNILRMIRSGIIQSNSELFKGCKSNFHPYLSNASFFYPLEYLFSIIAEYAISNGIITLNDITGDMDNKEVLLMIEGPLRLFV